MRQIRIKNYFLRYYYIFGVNCDAKKRNSDGCARIDMNIGRNVVQFELTEGAIAVKLAISVDIRCSKYA